MAISKIQQNFIDRYLKDELDEAEIERFNLELEKNTEFKNEYIFQRALLRASGLQSVKHVIEKARINNILKSKQTHPQFKAVQDTINDAKTNNLKHYQRGRIKKWLFRGTIAASILLIGLAGKNHFLKFDVDKELNSVFKNVRSYAYIEPEIQEVGARAEVIGIKLNRLNDMYMQRQFDEASNIIQQLKIQYNFSSDDLKYLEAVLFAQSEEYGKSIEVLRKLIEENSAIGGDARWLRGLLLIKINNKPEAKKELDILIEESEKYKFEARKALETYY